MQLPAFIAHRGASGEAPENTIEAFELAAKQGASWVELDVQLTRDLVPIVCHDEGLLRLAHVNTPVYEFNLSELKQLEVGSWFDDRFDGIQIPTLQEVLQVTKRLGLAVNIELKPNMYTGEVLAQKVVDTLKTFDLDQSMELLISSMHIQILHQFATLVPHTQLPQAWIVKRWNPNWLALVAQLPSLLSIHLDERLLTKQRIHEIQQNGYAVLAFTVNDMDRVKQLQSWGVDGFFTDHIAQFVKAAP